MNLKRTMLLALGSGAVGVWISTASTSVPPPVLVPAPSPAAIAVDNSGADLASEISRLHERLHPTAVPLQTRDLFQYAVRPAAKPTQRPAVVTPQAIEAPTPVVTAAPAMKLIGIAEDGAGEALVRTAIIAGLNDLFLLKEGENLAGRYRVGAISSSGVELIDTGDESVLSLTLP